MIAWTVVLPVALAVGWVLAPLLDIGVRAAIGALAVAVLVTAGAALVVIAVDPMPRHVQYLEVRPRPTTARTVVQTAPSGYAGSVR